MKEATFSNVAFSNIFDNFKKKSLTFILGAHADTPRSSPRALKEGEDVIAEDNEGQASPNSPHTPASPRRGYPFLPSSHCPLHCPHKAFLAQVNSINEVSKNHKFTESKKHISLTDN